MTHVEGNGLDAALLALTREFDGTVPAVIRLEDERDALPRDHPRVDVLDAQVKALVSRRWELREAITDVPARTPEGLIAKAKVALWELSDGDPEEGPTYGNSTVAWSLALDVSGGSVMNVTSDAELVALAGEFERLQQQINPLVERFFGMSEGDPELERVGAAQTELVEQQDELAERAKDLPATTLAGVRAKATIARRFFQRHYSNEDEAACYGEELGFAWRVINDILSMGEGAN